MARKKKKDESKLDKDLQKTLNEISKEYGDGSIMLLGSRGHLDIPSIPTGSLALDIDLGIGGFPRGRIVEIYGPESSGKTTLCASVCANAQKQGGVCAFVDSEHALDPAWMETIGCNVNDLLISQPNCGEDALGITEKLLLSNKIAVIVVDSVAALVPRAEIEGQMGDSHVGLQARLMSQAMRKLNGAVSKSNTCLIFTNQIREKIGVMFGNPETTTGGNALKFYASIRVDIRKRDRITGSESEHPIGNAVKYNIVKNKMAAPFRKGEFDILYDSGINPAYSVVTVGESMDIIEKRGSWYSYNENQIGQGKIAAVKTLLENTEMMAEIDHKIRVKSGLIEEENDSATEDGKDDNSAPEDSKDDNSAEGSGDESK